MAGNINNSKSLINLIHKEINGKRKGCLSNTDLSNVLKEIVIELCNNINTLESNITSSNSLVSVIQSQLIQEIANRSSEDANLQNQITQLLSSDNDILNQLSQEIADRITADATLQANIDTNSTAITVNADDITALQLEDADLQTQINSNDNELTSQQQQIVSNDIDIANLQGQLSINTQDISDLQTTVQNINTNSVQESEIEDIFDNYPVFNSMQQAISTIGLGKIFVYSEQNEDGVPSPNGSAVSITKP